MASLANAQGDGITAEPSAKDVPDMYKHVAAHGFAPTRDALPIQDKTLEKGLTSFKLVAC